MTVNYKLLNNEILNIFGTPKGPNCSEGMLMYGIKTFDLNVPDDILRIATPFGGGIAKCEDTCGTITGAIMLIGLKYGRTNLDQDKYKAYHIGEEFFKWFRNEFGSTNCYELNHGDYDSKEHRDRCGGLFITKSIEYLDELFEKVDSGEWQPSE